MSGMFLPGFYFGIEKRTQKTDWSSEVKKEIYWYRDVVCCVRISILPRASSKVIDKHDFR